MNPPSRLKPGSSSASAAASAAALAGSGACSAAAAAAISAGQGSSARHAPAISAAAIRPSRTAARSRGPPRPTTSRASARARSGAALSRAMSSDRIPDAATSAATESRRSPIAAGAVNGAARRCANSREPAAVTVRSMADKSEPRRSPLEVRTSSRLARVAASMSSVAPPDSRAVESIAGERRHRGQRTPERCKLGILVERVGKKNLAGLEPRDLGGERVAAAFGDAKLAGRYVEERDGKSALLLGRGAAGAGDGRQIIVAAGIEQGILGQRARRDQAHDVAPHYAFSAAAPGFGGILELLANGDAMAERDQPVQIFLGALDRNAAHRDVAIEMLAALGQHDAERAAGDLGVLEKQFVEIPHAVEQQAIGVAGLDLEVLRHHRADAVLAPGAQSARGVRTRFGDVRLARHFELHARRR